MSIKCWLCQIEITPENSASPNPKNNICKRCNPLYNLVLRLSKLEDGELDFRIGDMERRLEIHRRVRERQGESLSDIVKQVLRRW